MSAKRALIGRHRRWRGNNTERPPDTGPGAHSADGDELDKNEAPVQSRTRILVFYLSPSAEAGRFACGVFGARRGRLTPHGFTRRSCASRASIPLRSGAIRSRGGVGATIRVL